METSKLFDRFDRDMPTSGANVFAVDVDGFDLIGVVSSHLLISVADDASDVIIDIKSEFVTTIPVFLKNPGDFGPLADADMLAADDDVAITGFSEARRFDGIGVNCEPTKSEYRRFV